MSNTPYCAMWLDKFMPRFYLLALLTIWKLWSGFKTVFWFIQVMRKNNAIWYRMKQQANKLERGRWQRVETGWGKFPNILSPVRKGILAMMVFLEVERRKLKGSGWFVASVFSNILSLNFCMAWLISLSLFVFEILILSLLHV